MKLPKKISPDNIKDSVVEIRYEAAIPHEILVGLIYGKLSPNFKYTNRPLVENNLNPLNINIPKEILIASGVSLFYNDKIKIQVQPNSIVFNCLKEYILWDNYFKQIRNVMTVLYEIGITKYTRIGLRYINEYPNMELKNFVNFNFQFGMPQVESDLYIFKSEFRLNPFKVILNLKNRVLTQKINTDLVESTSYIDIDVILEKIEINKLEELFLRIDEAHTTEKNIFFHKLLKEEYLKKVKIDY